MASKIRCITCLEELRDKVTKAVESVAVFATEWGTCDASGDGTLNFEETKTWLLGLLWHAVAICSLGFGTVWVIIDTCWEMLSIPTWCNTLRSPCFLRHDEIMMRHVWGWTSLNAWTSLMPTGPSATSRKLVPHFCRVPAEKVDGKIVTWDFYVETNKQQCRSSVEVWSVYESMWMNVNHEAHTRCATFINYQYIMKMWCHMISHHKMSQDAWGDLRILKIWRMLISIFETKVSSRNRDTLCGPCCEVRPCPANYLNRVLLWRRLHRDNAPIPLMTALRPCVVTNWAPNASWHVLNVVDISWSLLI